MKDDFINYTEKEPPNPSTFFESASNGYDSPAFQHDEKPEHNDQLQKNKKIKKNEKSKEKMVGILKLFGYADWLDIILMIIGLIAAVANGTGLPLLIVVFGEMTNSFVTMGQAVNVSSDNLSAVINSSSTCPAIPGLDIEAEMTSDINTIHEGIGDKFCIFVQFFATFLTGIVIGFVYVWKLTLVILSVSPLLAAAATVGSIFGYADWLDIILMIIGLIAAVANGTGMPLLIVVFGEMTNSFVTMGQAINMSSDNLSAVINSSSTCPAIPGLDIEAEMTRFAYYYVGIGFAVMILSTIQDWTFFTSAARQTARIRQKFFFAILHQEMAWFDTSQIGTLNTRLTDDINTIHEGIGDKFCIFVQFFATFLTGIVIGFIYGWKLTLVILSVSPLLAAAATVGSIFLASFTTKELSAYARAGAVAEEILTAIRTVVAFNGQMKALAKYDVNLENARKVGVKKSITTNTTLGFTEFILFGTYALAFWYGTKLTVEEKENYDIGRVLIVLFSVLHGTFSLGQGSPHLESVANARGAAYEVYKVISKILKGLNLKVQSGKTIALVGSSGCGKSTTIQLLQRFYDPVQGEITLDGRDIRTLNIKWLRERIGLVSQEPILFATTIAENIRCGREGITDSEIEKAAKEANAFDFISRLPDKFNTMVGERGAQLSGGQKQRIAIARALARNPRILLLDEATSALDTQSESIVQAALDKARAGRTTIVIAHRLSTIRTADLLAGFHNGGVVEQGTHNELMTQKGVYCSLVMQQGHGGNTQNEMSESDEETEDEDCEEEDLDDLRMENLTDPGGFEEPGIIEMGSIPKRSRRRKSRKTSCKKKSFEKKKKTKEKEVSIKIQFNPKV
ncbi:peptide methionine sulfoxide reductase MsrB [Platysternon megacephalum]|uniref:ABC-type xenobiotic transporter n=1 Tax=Platysternon megacephalum TaxID=55544 RepID=A0A4D9DMH8_9SAUR|nr:peptide methionine sulfoxide reductase MsrB [Platysternon megacephalum]